MTHVPQTGQRYALHATPATTNTTTCHINPVQVVKTYLTVRVQNMILKMTQVICFMQGCPLTESSGGGWNILTNFFGCDQLKNLKKGRGIISEIIYCKVDWYYGEGTIFRPGAKWLKI